MLVALSKEVSWKVDGPLSLETNEPSVLQLTITNTGNTLVSGAIDITSPSGWDVDFDGVDSVNLEAGQSQKIRLDITATKPGDGTLSISISGADDVINSKIVLDVSSEGEAITDESSGMSPVVLSILVIIPLVIIVWTRYFLEEQERKINSNFCSCTWIVCCSSTPNKRNSLFCLQATDSINDARMSFMRGEISLNMQGRILCQLWCTFYDFRKC